MSGYATVRTPTFSVEVITLPVSDVERALKSVSFIEKDSKRFPDASGWGYAQFLYDVSSDTFKPFGNDISFGKKICYQCHTAVTSRDFIFTDYPKR